MLSYVPLHVCPRWLRGIRTEKIHKFSSVPPPFVREDSSFGLVDTHRQPGAKLGIQDDKINLILTRVNVQKGEREKKKKSYKTKMGILIRLIVSCAIDHVQNVFFFIRDYFVFFFPFYSQRDLLLRCSHSQILR